MKLDLDFQIVDLDGKEITSASESLATFLANPAFVKGLNSRKAWGFAKKIKADRCIEIDKTDLELIASAIEEAGISIYCKAQLGDKIADCLREG